MIHVTNLTPGSECNPTTASKRTRRRAWVVERTFLGLGFSSRLSASVAGPPVSRVALTPGCHWIGYMDHTGCHMDHTGCHQLLSSTVRPAGVDTPLPWGCQIGYMDHTGCHQLDVFRRTIIT
jgi:hypothetical protein